MFSPPTLVGRSISEARKTDSEESGDEEAEMKSGCEEEEEEEEEF